MEEMGKQQRERMLLQAAFDGNLRLLRSNPTNLLLFLLLVFLRVSWLCFLTIMWLLLALATDFFPLACAKRWHGAGHRARRGGRCCRGGGQRQREPRAAPGGHRGEDGCLQIPRRGPPSRRQPTQRQRFWSPSLRFCSSYTDSILQLLHELEKKHWVIPVFLKM